MTLQDAIARIRAGVPVIEFALSVDWWQLDVTNNMMRWRHHRSSNWAGWRMHRVAERRQIIDNADQSTVRIVPRAEADDWRSRPGFPCHQETP